MAEAVRVAIANDYEIVISGVGAVLDDYPEKVRNVELAAGAEPPADVDVVLYDTFGQPQGSDIELERFSVGGRVKVVVFSWNTDKRLIDGALDSGLAGYICKTVTGEELADAIVRVAQGDRVVLTPDGDDNFGSWPGKQLGITNRESEVLALITQGYSNDEICQQIVVTLNTLKSYIRSLYQKIDVDTRAQAVRWGMSNGFWPDSEVKR